MIRKIHTIYDVILKLIIMAYANEFLLYIGEKRSIKRILNTEIITKKGRKLYLDFLCELEDGTLLNIEFQFTGPDENDLDRFFDYNIFSETEYDSRCETIIINPRTSKAGQKTRKIGQSKTSHPMSFYLGDIDFEKILNSIENKALHNLKLTNSDEISLMLMCLLPKYKNKEELLERICEIHKKEDLFDFKKINAFKAVIGLEIEKFVSKNKIKDLKGKIRMTPEAEKMIDKALRESREKHVQLERERLTRELTEKITIDIAKKLKKYHTPREIAKITGLSLATVLKL